MKTVIRVNNVTLLTRNVTLFKNFNFNMNKFHILNVEFKIFRLLANAWLGVGLNGQQGMVLFFRKYTF